MVKRYVFSTLLSIFLFFFSLIAFAGVLEKEVTFDKGDISFTEIKGYDFVKLEGCRSTTRKIGAPCLPRASFSLLIPQGADVIDVEVISFDKEEIRGEYDIYPTQHPQPFMKDKVFPFVDPDTDIYSQAVPYPEKIAENPNTGSMGGYRLASVLVYPLQYVPAEKKLVFYSRIKFKITYEENLSTLKTKTEKQNKLFGERVRNLILNPEDLGTFEPFVGINSSLDLSPDTVEHVIITVDSFASTFRELADWKTKKGVPSKVVTLDSIYANYTGADNAERIRNFIIDANSTWGTIWVLLGGQCDYEWGQEIVPRRNAFYILIDWDETDTIPTDLYFSDLDGDWNADGDGVYGESTDNVDLYSDVFVGRAPVRTVSQAEEFVEKVLTYEKKPPSGYLKKILLPAAILWSSYDEQLSQEAIANMIPGDWQVSRMYERDGNLTHAAFVDSVRSGAGFAHLVGHGNQYGIYTYYASEYFDSDDLDALGNDSLLGIHNSIGCMCGAIDFVAYGDCFAEHYLTPSTGGSYSIMNSRYGWGDPPIMGPSENIDTCFYHEIFSESYSYHDHIGVAHAFSKDGYVSEVTWSDIWAWCIYELNLFGDPEMPLWTDDPGELTVSHDAVTTVGASSFSVNVSDGASPVEDALVCLYKEGEVYETGYTNTSGDIVLTLSPPPSTLGIMYCTVTKNNYRPYEDSVEVISPDGPWVIFDHYTVTDISGNGDGNVDPGDSIELALTVHNVGDSNGVGITGIIRTGDSYVTIIDSTGDFGDILADSLAESPDSFDFYVSPGCPANHNINFELVCSDASDSTWTSQFSIPISTPDISTMPDTLNFDTVFIGYNDTLELLVSNNGTDTLRVSNITSDNMDYSVAISNFNVPPDESQALAVIFTPSSPGLSAGNLTIESNDPDEPTLNVYLLGEGLLPPDISVSPDSLCDSLLTGETSTDTLIIHNYGNSNLNFNISIGTEAIGALVSSQKSNSTSGEIPVPLIETSKGEEDTREYPLMIIGSGGPDGFGYRWKDSNEPDGPSFNWIDVSSGTSISLSDDDFQTGIPLGFTFNYYGTDFTTIGVGSNGWLSFNGSDDWYPSNVPNSDVYDGAIAPFARDLYPPSASYIRYQTFGVAPNRYSVIEYNDIPDWVGENYKTFEVIFYENSNEIKFQYLTAPNDPEGFGIESPDESMGMGNAGADSLFISPAVVEDNYAIEFSIAPDWISPDISSGTVPAGDSTIVEVTFDATDLYSGDYDADIIIASNDPDEPEVVVPAHLHVTGAPDITVSEDTLDYGIVYPGHSVTDTLLVANAGTDTLIVSEISSDNGDYTVDTTNFVLEPEENQAVLVTFNPSSLGAIIGLLTIESNDPDDSTLIIYMSGECMNPPDIYVSPDSLSDTLLSGQTSNHTLTIYNTGESDLNFDISINGGGSAYAVELDGVDAYVEVPDNPSLSAIGRALTLEFWMNVGEYPFQSREVLGKWGSGSSSDDEYDIDFLSSGRIRMSISGSTGGLTSLTSDTTLSPYTWTHVAGVFDSASTSFKLFINGDLDANTTPSTITLDRDTDQPFRMGTYDFYWYDNFKGQLDEVRIWNVARTQGEIQANMYRGLGGNEPGLIGYWRFDAGAGDTAYDYSPNNNDGTLLDGAAWTDSTAAPVIGWLYVDTTSGTVPANDSAKIEVTFDATGLDAGDYFADIIITSNDPDETELIVPAYLHVPAGGVKEKGIPEIFFVKQNYPNPFSSQTVIRFGCPKKSKVCIQIFDVTGRIVNTLIDKEVEAGYHDVKWEGENKLGRKIANAVYFYRMQAGDFIATKKMIFLR